MAFPIQICETPPVPVQCIRGAYLHNTGGRLKLLQGGKSLQVQHAHSALIVFFVVLCGL